MLCENATYQQSSTYELIFITYLVKTNCRSRSAHPQLLVLNHLFPALDDTADKEWSSPGYHASEMKQKSKLQSHIKIDPLNCGPFEDRKKIVVRSTQTNNIKN